MRATIRILCFALLVAVCFAGAAAQAMPEPQYLLQDNFFLLYGVAGNPLAAGATIDTIGSVNRLVHWDRSETAAWFELHGVANNPVTVNGNVASTVFDSGTFTITSTTGGVVLWTGNIENLVVRTKVDATKYPAGTYPRPSFETQPVDFEAVGSGSFVRTGGTWTDSRLALDWFGTYNTDYDVDRTYASGNLQGRLLAPEPGSIAGLLCGFIGLTGFVAARKRR